MNSMIRLISKVAASVKVPVQKKKIHKNSTGRYLRVLLVVVVLAGLITSLLPDDVQAAEGQEITVLFTHDIHSYLTPKDNGSGERYGLARMATKIKELRAKRDICVLVDAGDFSMGTLYQTLYMDEAAELVMLGKLGFDATTLGNHEFDYREAGLAKMLHAAKDREDTEQNFTLPHMLLSNLDWSKNTTDENKNLKEAWDTYGASEYTIVEKNGVKIGIFGIFGDNSEEDAPLSGLVFEEQIDTAKTMVRVLEEEGAELIVCLSHSGTSQNPNKSEDELLAKAVPEIDVIVSGHSHTILGEPIVYDHTYIVSCGCYTHKLGELTLKENAEGRYDIADYLLYPLTADIEEDAEIKKELDSYKDDINDKYLSRFGYTYDEVIAHNSVEFISINDYEVKGLAEEPLANVISDSYRYAVAQAEGEDAPPVDIAIAAKGMIRESIPLGDVTVKDVFDVCALGIGKDQVPGYPLVGLWLNGEELKTMAEIDVSISEGGTAQLYPSGAMWKYNPNRLILNRVTDTLIVKDDGSTIPVERDKLYRVVTPLYCAQMLGSVQEQSLGILKVIPKDADGQPIQNIEDFIIYNKDTGEEVKEWYALASYLESFDIVDHSLPEVPSEYADLLGRKVEITSRNPVELLKNPNKISITLYIVILVMIFIIVFVVRKIRKKAKKHAKKQEA